MCARFDTAVVYNMPFALIFLRFHILQDTPIPSYILKSYGAQLVHVGSVAMNNLILDAILDASAGCQTQFTHLLQQIQLSITGSLLNCHHQ